MSASDPESGEGAQPIDPGRRLASERKQMVQQQLQSRGVRDARVLAAMSRIPRECFLPQSLWSEAYQDSALPIAQGQTISQPYTVATMLVALQLEGTERVLEIGTGSGYNAALLSLLAREVFSVERIAELTERAEGIMSELGLRNVHLRTADGTLGWPDAGPFDAIIVTAGGPQVPPPLVDQLADGGRLVMPVGRDRGRQVLCRLTRTGDQIAREELGDYLFVPLVGEYGW